MLTRLAAGDARRRGGKVFYTAHGFHFYKGAPLVNWLLYYPVERLLSRRTDLLLTINSQDYRRAKTFHAKRTELVNGVGIDLSRFREASPEQKAQVRTELGLKEVDIFAFTAGNLDPGKNHKTLLHAMKQLNDPSFHLVLAGNGPLYGELEALARELGLEKQLHLLGFRRDVFRLSSAADMFLFSSQREGLSVSLMEAMACGLPIVASSVRGNTDLIDPGQGGFLVEPNDAAGFADAIRRILAQPGIREQMKQHNLKKIRTYSIEAVTEQIHRQLKAVEIYYNDTGKAEHAGENLFKGELLLPENEAGDQHAEECGRAAEDSAFNARGIGESNVEEKILDNGLECADC